MAQPTGHSDPANKRLFSHRRVVADLVRLLDDGWVEDVALERLERLPAEHVTDDLRKRLADMPWWAPFKDGGGRPAGAGVLFHLEFQSRPDPWMAERLLAYVALLRRDLRHSGWMPASAGELVVHLPLVVYNGRAPWNVPLWLAPPAWMPPELARIQPRFAYRPIEARHYAGDAVVDGNLARALLALDAAPADGLAAALKRTATLLVLVDDQELWRSFEVWYNGILRPRFGDSHPALANMMETPTMLEETLREWDEQLIDKGRREGRQGGLQEGLENERSMLRGMAERRFGAATGQGLAGILAGVDDNAELARISLLIVDCATGQDLLARARRP